MSKTTKTTPEVPVIKDKKLKADLMKYQQMALDMGASDARIVPISYIFPRIRARYVDIFPRENCEHTSYFRDIVRQIPWKHAKAILASYRYVIISHIPFPMENPNNFTGPTSHGGLEGIVEWYDKIWPAEELKYWNDVQNKRGGQRHLQQLAFIPNIVNEARKDGHQFAFSGSAGPCTIICCEAGFGHDCVALKTGICRMAGTGKIRPSGTSAIMGLDHPATYAKLGWKSWVGGWSAFPEDFPDPIMPTPARTSMIFID